MPRLFSLLLLPTLLMAGGKGSDGGSRLDAGTSAAPPASVRRDAGTADAGGVDAGTADAGSIDAGTPDAGCEVKPGEKVKSICWPGKFEPMAILDGAAIVAANAALQKVLARYPKEYAKFCEYSPTAMDVAVGKVGEWYFVQIDQRMDRCGWEVPQHFSFETDWFELYAVSPDGGVVERYPYHP